MNESKLITGIKEYLQLLENKGFLVFVRNNSGAFRKGKGFYWFGKKGSPDFFIFLKNGKVIHLECKSQDGKLSDTQQEYRNKIAKLGHKYYIIRTVYELDKILVEYGINL